MKHSDYVCSTEGTGCLDLHPVVQTVSVHRVSAREASDELITLNDAYRELLVADETSPFLSSCVFVSEGVQLREQLSGERLTARVNQRLIELDLDEVGVPHPEEDREQSTEEEADYYVDEADD